MVMEMKNFTIVGDGKFLAIIVDDTAYVIENYSLGSMSNSLICNYQDYFKTEIELKIVTFGFVKVVPAHEIRINNIENMSIFELFKAINDKIEKRNE